MKNKNGNTDAYAEDNENDVIDDSIDNSYDESQQAEESNNDIHKLQPSEIQNDFNIKMTSTTPKIIVTDISSDFSIEMLSTAPPMEEAAMDTSSTSNSTIIVATTASASEDKILESSTQLNGEKNNTSNVKNSIPTPTNLQKLDKLNNIINQNKFSSLKPVLNVISELLSNSFRSNYQQQQQLNNKTTDNTTKSAEDLPLDQQQQQHQQQPIYIPLGEQNYDLNEAESNQQFNYFPVNQIKHEYNKQSNMLLNGGDGAGIKISPGEIKTANSDVIIGKPSILGPRIPLQYNEDTILKPPALPVPKSTQQTTSYRINSKVNLIQTEIQHNQGTDNKYYVDNDNNQHRPPYQHPFNNNNNNHHQYQQQQKPPYPQPYHPQHHNNHPSPQLKVIPVRQFSDNNFNHNINAIRQQKFTLLNQPPLHQPPQYQNKFPNPSSHSASNQQQYPNHPQSTHQTILQQQQQQQSKQQQLSYNTKNIFNQGNSPPRNNIVHHNELYEIQQIPEVYSEDLPPTSVTYFPSGTSHHNGNDLEFLSLNKQLPTGQSEKIQEPQPTAATLQHQTYISHNVPISPPPIASSPLQPNIPIGNLVQGPSLSNDIGLIPPPPPHQHPHHSGNQKFNSNRLITQSQSGVRTSIKPLLVNIQPSRIANVLIPHGSTTALIFDGIREPQKTGQYFDEIAPHLESEVKFTSNVNKYIDNNEYIGKNETINTLQEQSSSQVSASVQFVDGLLNDKAPQQLTGETIFPQNKNVQYQQQINKNSHTPQFQPQEIHDLYHTMSEGNQNQFDKGVSGKRIPKPHQYNTFRNEQHNNNYQIFNSQHHIPQQHLPNNLHPQYQPPQKPHLQHHSQHQNQGQRPQSQHSMGPQSQSYNIQRFQPQAPPPQMPQQQVPKQQMPQQQAPQQQMPQQQAPQPPPQATHQLVSQPQVPLSQVHSSQVYQYQHQPAGNQPQVQQSLGQQLSSSQLVNLNDQHSILITNNKPIYTNHNVNFDSHILNKDVNVVVPPLQFTTVKVSTTTPLIDSLALNNAVQDNTVPYSVHHIDENNSGKDDDQNDFESNDEAVQETNTHLLTLKNSVQFNAKLSESATNIDGTDEENNIREPEQIYNQYNFKSNRTSATTPSTTPPTTTTIKVIPKYTTPKSSISLKEYTDKPTPFSNYYHTPPYTPSAATGTTTNPFRKTTVLSTTPANKRTTSNNNKNIFLMSTPFLTNLNTNEQNNPYYKNAIPFNQEQQQLSFKINNMENYELKPPPLPAAIKLLPLATASKDYSVLGFTKLNSAPSIITASIGSNMMNLNNFPSMNMVPPPLPIPSSNLVPPTSSTSTGETKYQSKTIVPTKISPQSFIINMTPPLPLTNQVTIIPTTVLVSPSKLAPTRNSIMKNRPSQAYEPYYDTSINHSFKPIYDNRNKVRGPPIDENSKHKINARPTIRLSEEVPSKVQIEVQSTKEQNKILSITTTKVTPKMESIVKQSTEKNSVNDYDEDEMDDIVTAKNIFNVVLSDGESIDGSNLNTNNLIKPSTYFGYDNNNFILTVKSSMPLLNTISSTEQTPVTPNSEVTKKTTLTTTESTIENKIKNKLHSTFDPIDDYDDPSPIDSINIDDGMERPRVHDHSSHYDDADEDDIIITGESVHGSSQDLVRYIPVINNGKGNDLIKSVTSSKLMPNLITSTTPTASVITETTTTTKNLHKITKIIKLVPTTVLKTIVTTQTETIKPTKSSTVSTTTPSIVIDYLNNHQTQNFRQKTKIRIVGRPSNITTGQSTTTDRKNLTHSSGINSQFTHPQSDNDNFYVLLTENNLSNNKKNKKIYQIDNNGATEIEKVSAGAVIVGNRDEENIVKEPNRVLVGGILIASPPHVGTSKFNLPQVNNSNPHNYYHHNYYNEMNVLNINDCIDCKSSRNEYCKLVDKMSKCVCRKGFSRLFPDRPCKRK